MLVKGAPVVVDTNTVWCPYNTANFLTNIHKRHHSLPVRARYGVSYVNPACGLPFEMLRTSDCISSGKLYCEYGFSSELCKYEYPHKCYDSEFIIMLSLLYCANLLMWFCWWIYLYIYIVQFQNYIIRIQLWSSDCHSTHTLYTTPDEYSIALKSPFYWIIS